AVGLLAGLLTVGACATPRAAEAALGRSPDQVRAALHLAVGPHATTPAPDACAGGEATALELAVRRAAAGGPAATPPPARPSSCGAIALPLDRPFRGVYDPASSMAAPADAEEVFVQWKLAVGAEIRAHLARILAARRAPIVVVEPYPWNVDGLTDATLLGDIAAGRYDQ